MKPTTEQIRNSKNMVEVEHLIASATMFYLNEFARTERMFNRKVETQEEWIRAARTKYDVQILSLRRELFSAIPERFYVTEMYKSMSV